MGEQEPGGVPSKRYRFGEGAWDDMKGYFLNFQDLDQLQGFITTRVGVLYLVSFP